MSSEGPRVQISPAMALTAEMYHDALFTLATLGNSDRVAKVVAAVIVANQPELAPFQDEIAVAVEKLLEELRHPDYGRYASHVRFRRQELAKVQGP